jgi:hypothetical protein
MIMQNVGLNDVNEERWLCSTAFGLKTRRPVLDDEAVVKLKQEGESCFLCRAPGRRSPTSGARVRPGTLQYFGREWQRKKRGRSLRDATPVAGFSTCRGPIRRRSPR